MGKCRSINRTGRAYGDWEILGRAGKGYNRNAVWHGRNRRTGELSMVWISGKRAIRVKPEQLVPEHQTGTFDSFSAMLNRIENAKRPSCKQDKGYADVKVCDDWNPATFGGGWKGRKEAFRRFVRHMGLREAGDTLDRIDPYGNYDPTNCRWADKRVQAANKRLKKLFGDGPEAV